MMWSVFSVSKPQMYFLQSPTDLSDNLCHIYHLKCLYFADNIHCYSHGWRVLIPKLSLLA